MEMTDFSHFLNVSNMDAMWTPTKNKRCGVAIYNYDGNIKFGLQLEIGETVQVLEECGGWFRGFSTRNKKLKGIFPSSYIHLRAFCIDPDGISETITPVEDTTVREVACVLREWLVIWKRLYVRRENTNFSRLQTVMRELIECRRQLITGTLTQDQIRELKGRITTKIDWGNKQLGLDLVPRVENEIVETDALSPVDIYQVHLLSSENVSGLGGRGTIKRKEPKRAHTHHLYLCLRDFSYTFIEDVEIYFSLYDSQQAEFLSERFLVRFTKSGMSHFVEKLHNHCTVFTDLGNADLGRDLYIVAHIIRTGRMLNDSKKSTTHFYRRPYGCAVLKITDFLLERTNKDSLEDEENFQARVYTCNEGDFYQLHEFIIKRQNNKYNPLPGQSNCGLELSLRMMHGELINLQQETPLLFKNLSITHKRGFSDVIMPGDVRNDLYLSLERGEFEKGGKSTGKNIEATVILVNSEGNVLEKCICSGSGQDNITEYQSTVLYHNNSPHWIDMIKLAVPIEKFDGAHVRIEYRHCSTRDKEKKLLGFSFIQLMDDKGTILWNGSHEIYVYKCEDHSKLQDPRGYLSLPSGPKDGGGSTPGSTGSSGSIVPPSPPPFPTAIAGYCFNRSARETVHIQTLLCSTKLTQNGDLLNLLKWKAHPDRIQEILNKVMNLNGEEIVKFLQDIFDALFSMFSTGDGNSTAHSGLVFKVLVHILSLLEDNKFEHFKPVMDTYITGHFAAALVYKGLLSCVKHCADLVRDADKQDAIQNCFHSLEYVFKFIIQSRILFARATGDQNEDAFKSELYGLFNSFNRMLSINHDLIILPTQIALVSSFSHIYEQLLKVLPIQEVAKIVKLTIDCLPSDPPIRLIQAKLKCIHDTVKSTIFQDSDCRIELLDVFARHIREHMAHQQELRLCSDILGDILRFLHKELENQRYQSINEQSNTLYNTFSALNAFGCGISQEIEILILGLFEVLIITVKDVDRTSAVAGPLVACLIALLRLTEGRHYFCLWEKFGSRMRRDKRQLKDLLICVFIVFHELVKQDIFPRDWVVMRMLTNHVILCSLQEFCQPLITDFLDGTSFNEQLWSNYFTLAVSYLTQPSLQLENFTELKREKILGKYNDMRVLMGFQILEMWDKLGEHKINFIPAMVGHFLEVTLVPEIKLRKATLPVFFDMMDCEQKNRGNFKQVESELIDKLDILVSENKGDDEYRQLFNTILLEKVRSNDPVWKDNGIAFINSITRLLERLLDYRNVMEGEENKDKRMSCTVNLLNFYKNEINRKEMYIRYIYKLCDLHRPAENYAEAAFTLKLHADLLNWSTRILPSDQRHQQQPEWQRRENLYHKIIGYFDKGKCWEEGIPLCKELAELYEKKLFDYSKLSSVLKTQATFFDNILNQRRPEPEYFRVGFYGIGFPLFLRNKVFVYRGLEYERIGAFTQRLQTEFPHAQILMKNNPPDDSIMNADGQYIQICNVKPIPELRLEFEGHDIPEKILSYYLVNDVRTFQFDRPLHKGQVDKDNEFKSLWIERTTLTTASHMPGILRWFEVTDKHTEELSPITHACESVESMNKELRQLIAQYSPETQRSINPLSMRLQGVIEAAVNGGIAKYQEAFFTSEFAYQHPDETEKISHLKSLILEKVQILEGGLSLHGRLAPQEVQPLHVHLVECFTVMKQSIRETDSPNLTARLSGNKKELLTASVNDPGETRRPSIVNTPLPPIPNESAIKKSLDCSSNRSSSSGSSIYGHFLAGGSDDEDLYTRLQDENKTIVSHPSSSRESPTLIAQPPSRPRSVAFSSGSESKTVVERPSRPPSRIRELPHPPRGPLEDNLGYATPSASSTTYSLPLKLPQSHNKTDSPKFTSKWNHLSSPDSSSMEGALIPDNNSPSSSPIGSSRNSWSEINYFLENEAPPLPPRGGERKMTTSQIANNSEEIKPAIPRRLVKKDSAPPVMQNSREAHTLPIYIDPECGNLSPLTTPDSHVLGVFYCTSPSNESIKQPPPIPIKKSSIVNIHCGENIATSSSATPLHSPELTTDPLIQRPYVIPSSEALLSPQKVTSCSSLEADFTLNNSSSNSLNNST